MSAQVYFIAFTSAVQASAGQTPPSRSANLSAKISLVGVVLPVSARARTRALMLVSEVGGRIFPFERVCLPEEASVIPSNEDVMFAGKDESGDFVGTAEICENVLGRVSCFAKSPSCAC